MESSTFKSSYFEFISVQETSTPLGWLIGTNRKVGVSGNDFGLKLTPSLFTFLTKRTVGVLQNGSGDFCDLIEDPEAVEDGWQAERVRPEDGEGRSGRPSRKNSPPLQAWRCWHRCCLRTQPGHVYRYVYSLAFFEFLAILFETDQWNTVKFLVARHS